MQVELTPYYTDSNEGRRAVSRESWRDPFRNPGSFHSAEAPEMAPRAPGAAEGVNADGKLRWWWRGAAGWKVEWKALR